MLRATAYDLQNPYHFALSPAVQSNLSLGVKQEAGVKLNHLVVLRTDEVTG